MVEFRKRLDDDILSEINEMIIEYNKPDDMETYGELPEKQIIRLKTIQTVYEQQKYMYDNNTHTVPDRIVSLSQPYIRPIIRGKSHDTHRV